MAETRRGLVITPQGGGIVTLEITSEAGLPPIEARAAVEVAKYPGCTWQLLSPSSGPPWTTYFKDPNAPVDLVKLSDARVDSEDDAWVRALVSHLPAMLAEHSDTGDIDTNKWLGRVRATVKTIRRPRG